MERIAKPCVYRFVLVAYSCERNWCLEAVGQKAQEESSPDDPNNTMKDVHRCVNFGILKGSQCLY
jgi:hypothetical protein